ncbi:MAG: hypothetical protein H6888_02800 [Nitratireductor sp.]|nr:hypothetical protein [Nitratireductor sp.]MCC0019983.1 hypothetical protein [Nitratireductor sp.]
MKMFVAAAAVAAAVAVPLSAFAAKTGDNKGVNFQGTVTHTCSITVDNDGELGVSTDFATLASNVGAGSAGAATVAATGNTFKLYVDSPASWSGPTSPTSVSASVSGDISTSSASASGAAVSKGEHSVSVNMSATAADFFEEGDYSATVTLRCE